jgi:hypothetical protein
MRLRSASILALLTILISCDKKDPVVVPPASFSMANVLIDGNGAIQRQSGVSKSPLIKILFTSGINTNSAEQNISVLNNLGIKVPSNISFENNDSTVLLTPQNPLSFLTQYKLTISEGLVDKNNGTINTKSDYPFLTVMDSTDKFPRISDNSLLDSVQRRSFAFFWEFGHPVSGMARERNSSGDLVTSGGTGFGIMAMVSAANRGFITRTESRDRILKIVDFLSTKAIRYHGAFAHWLNGANGATIPFSANDNGADLVETSYLVNGLLCARQYFNNNDPAEIDLRAKINAIWNGVEWNWFRQNSQDVLYWHWSNTGNWAMNFKVEGWNEAMIVYALAASANTDSIPVSVYQKGWARNGNIKNGNSYYGYPLPLGPSNGGPLFFAHYSFLGINPNGLSDAYADYKVQVTNHTKINYAYCAANPRKFYGYSNQCWGLTASDVPGGYNANEPNNDRGVISPTAALSSFPYTPVESMAALKFFYYKLGDKIWKQYGFVDAFSLHDPWFADSFLAIDQGPIIVMIENYRTGLLWDLFTSCPEIKRGMKRLGYSAPFL